MSTIWKILKETSIRLGQNKCGLLPTNGHTQWRSNNSTEKLWIHAEKQEVVGREEERPRLNDVFLPQCSEQQESQGYEQMSGVGVVEEESQQYCHAPAFPSWSYVGQISSALSQGFPCLPYWNYKPVIWTSH